MSIPEGDELFLFMVLLGSKAPDRNVEQHDYFFGIAKSLKDLVPAFKAFWPEAGNSLHIDGWRKITKVGNYRINVIERNEHLPASTTEKLFFINLGGYQAGKLEEQHYTVLSVNEDRLQAIKESKRTIFFKTNSLKGAANAHIDEKYGIDVDDIYRIEDVLASEFKDEYCIEITPDTDLKEDEIWLGYMKLDKVK